MVRYVIRVRDTSMVSERVCIRITVGVMKIKRWLLAAILSFRKG